MEGFDKPVIVRIPVIMAFTGIATLESVKMN